MYNKSCLVLLVYLTVSKYNPTGLMAHLYGRFNVTIHNSLLENILLRPVITKVV